MARREGALGGRPSVEGVGEHDDGAAPVGGHGPHEVVGVHGQVDVHLPARRSAQGGGGGARVSGFAAEINADHSAASRGLVGIADPLAAEAL